MKWGLVYMAELFLLPPEAVSSLKTEGFRVQGKEDAPFESVSDDHATEWVNGISKEGGKLGKITQIQSATLK